MRKRTLLSNQIIGKPIENATYSDVCFYDKENNNKVIVDPSEINTTDYPLERFTPIGIVAIPSSHTDEKRPRIISLVEMSISTPDIGTLTYYKNISWGGGNHSIENLLERNYYPYLERSPSDFTESSTVKYNVAQIFMPSDYFSISFTKFENPLNSIEYFRNGYGYCMCSPYKEDGSKEPRYFDTSNSRNVLADFDGKGNTDKILQVDNSYSTAWKTAEYLSTEGGNQYIHPAAQCCWRFHTEGTNQGDWYLPSAGEIGYAVARHNAIRTSMIILNNQYNEELIAFISTDFDYWSSTPYEKSYASTISFEAGNIYNIGKSTNRYVRAFLKL